MYIRSAYVHMYVLFDEIILQLHFEGHSIYVNCIKWNLIEFLYIAISRFQHTCLYIRVHFFCMIFVLRNLHKMEFDGIFVHCNFKVTANVFFINDVDVLKYNKCSGYRWSCNSGTMLIFE